MKGKNCEIRLISPLPSPSASSPKPVVNTQSEVWLTREQMAIRLRVSVRTIDYWTEDGTLPVYKKGRVVRYDPVECAVALQAFRKKSRFEVKEMQMGID
jgi:excisionase family DNA binding protein